MHRAVVAMTEVKAPHSELMQVYMQSRSRNESVRPELFSAL